MSSQSNQILEELLEQAIEGEPKIVRAFLLQFLSSMLQVPTRTQSLPINELAEYQNDLIQVLALNAGDRVIVPIFTRPELVESWAGQKLQLRELSAKQLCDLVPQDWWLCLNPGQNVEKEFSPWEIAQLKLGPECIDDLIAENQPEEDLSLLKVSAVNDEILLKAKDELSAFAQSEHSILKMAFLKGSDLDENEKMLLLVETSHSSTNSLHVQLEKIVAPHLIGNYGLRVLISKSGADHLHAGLLAQSVLFYERRSVGITGKLLSCFRKK